MHEKQFNQIIGFGIMAIILYYILQMVIPFLIYGVIGLIAWRVYLEFKRHK